MLRFLQLGAHPPRRSPHPDPLPRGEREKGGAVGKTLSLDGRGCGRARAGEGGKRRRWHRRTRNPPHPDPLPRGERESLEQATEIPSPLAGEGGARAAGG
jgi:hypothetical protein